jgi:hypothetical protein
MHKLALISVPVVALMGLGQPARAADLDGPPVYRDEGAYERPGPPVVIEKRIIEHHYYEPEPEPEVRAYYFAPPAYYAPGYRYVDGYPWRRRAFFGHHYRRWHAYRY